MSTSSSERRVVEIMSAGYAWARSLADVMLGAVVGAVFTFLAIVVVGVMGEEALAGYDFVRDLDPLFRSAMGVVLLAAPILGFGLPLALVVDGFAARRAAHAHVRRHPAHVPTAALRHQIARSPGRMIRGIGFGLSVLGISATALCALMLLVDDELRIWGVWVALGAGVVCAVLGSSVSGLGQRVTRHHEDEDEVGKGARSVALSAAVGAEYERRASAPAGILPRIIAVPSPALVGRVNAIGLGVVGAAVLVFLVSLFLRQQCRTCEPVTWGEPMENGIDVLSLIGGGALIASTLLGAVLWAFACVIRIVHEAVLARWAADGTPRRVDLDILRPFLTTPRALTRIARACGAVAAAVLMLATAASWSEWPWVDPSVGFVAGASLWALGLVLGAWDAGRERRERQALRDVTFPGDIAALKSPRRAEADR